MSSPNDLLTFGAQNLQAAYLRASVIEALSNSDSQDKFQTFLTGLGITLQCTFFQGPNAPTGILRYAVLSGGPLKFLFINGIETLTQGASVWAGFTGPPLLPQPAGVGISTPMTTWANFLITTILPSITPYTQIYVCGHSAGGYLANVVAKTLAGLTQQASNITVVTFGTPKLGINEGMPAGMARYHWYNDDDPVPTIPPVPTTSSPWVFALTPLQIVAITFFNQYNPGIQLNADGTLTLSVGPPSLPAPDWISAAAWLLELAISIPSPHNIQAYTSRLLLAVQTQRVWNPPVPTPVVPVRQADVGPRRARVILQDAVQTVFHTDRPAAVLEAIVPAAQAFTVKRTGRAYVVYFGDTIIVVGPHRRTAHGLARMGNAFLRRLQTEGRVDPSALVQQLELYLEAASSDPSFNPLMNVVTT